ncbi:MAG: MbnP family protein [Alteromonas sp.]|uniref:MbnP family protein n=1 Tax=Alteromonas sp. TaxID=232 RepID=UPI0032D90A2B
MNMHSRSASLLALLFTATLSLSGCDMGSFGSREAGEIPFKLVGVETDACPVIVRAGNDRWNIDYFGFYLSKPEVRVDGKWQRVKFKQTQWQTPSTALLKFHTMCSNPSDANDKIVLDVSEELLKLSTNLRFTMGLPLEQNHADINKQTSPINDKSMFANQLDGHMFLRLDVSKTGDPSSTWSYHLGNAGCEDTGIDEMKVEKCAFTNRVEFILPMTQLDTDLDLDISVSNIFAQLDINEVDDCKFASSEIAPCNKLINNLVYRPWIKWH